MKVSTRRGRVLVLNEPIGIVRAIGSLLLICSALSLCRGLMMIHEHEESIGVNNLHFWLYISIATLVLGLTLSSPPRWRWVFDLDLDRIHSFKVSFNVTASEGKTFPISEIEKAEVVRSENNVYQLELADVSGFRTVVEGIQSRSSGLPRIAALRINEIIYSFNQIKRAESLLNDPGIALREAGILVPIDPLLSGQALEALQQTIPDSLADVVTKFASAFDLTSAISDRFRGLESELLEQLKLAVFSDLQLLLLFDLCIPVLKTMHKAQYLELAARVDHPDRRRINEGVYSSALSARFNRYVGVLFLVSTAEPPTSEDLRGVLNECKTVIATCAAMAHGMERHLVPPKTVDGKEVVFVDASFHNQATLTMKRAFDAGLDELSSGLTADWTRPADTPDTLRDMLIAIKSASPIPMRNVLVRACARALLIDGVTEPREWALLRAIADTLVVSLPQFVSEPASEARVIEADRLRQ